MMRKKKILFISFIVVFTLCLFAINAFAESSCQHSYVNGQCVYCDEYLYPIPDDGLPNKFIFEMSPGIIQCISYNNNLTFVDKVYENGQSKFEITSLGMSYYRYTWLGNIGGDGWSEPETMLSSLSVPYITIFYETKEVTESHTHSYTSTIIRNPSCSLNGVEKYTCSCGYSYEEYIPRLSHTYTSNNISPTCVNEGYTKYICTVCGYNFKYNTIEPIGHDYKNGWCTRCDLPEFPDVELDRYTSILNDLGNDNKFSLSNYPAVSGKYELDLFQIAESKNGELFLYVYNPSAADVPLEAKYINMSLQHYENSNKTFKLYSLTLLSKEGTVSKYLVNNFKVQSGKERYYNIAAIYTPFNSNIHEPVNADDDIINYKGLPISTFFQANTDGNTVKYRANRISYVDVDIKDVGFVRLPEGYDRLTYEKSSDVHFIAFSVENFDVTKIYDVDVYFVTQDYHYYRYGEFDTSHEIYGDKVPIEKRVVYNKKVQVVSDAPLGLPIVYHKYEWNSILTLQEFRTILEEAKTASLNKFDEIVLNESEFVVSFYSSPYVNVVNTMTSHIDIQQTYVTEVALLRMHFSDPFGTYNLGVVSDIVSDDGIPDFEVTPDEDTENRNDALKNLFQGDDFEDLEMILFIIVAIVAIVLFVYLIPKIKKLVRAAVNVVSTAVETVVNTIKAPFDYIKCQKNKIAKKLKLKKTNKKKRK